MLGLFRSPFLSPFEAELSNTEARLLNLMNTLINDDEEFGFSTNENEQPKKKGKKEEAPKETETTRQFSSLKRSFLNGPHMIEETRETSIGPDGQSREVTTRRLGNKWFQRESITDKDGNKSTNERWHNVNRDQEDEFRKKWEEHRGDFGFDPLSLVDDTDKKAIKHDKK